MNKAIETSGKSTNKTQKNVQEQDESDEDTSKNEKVKRLHYKKLGRHYLADEVRKQERNAILTAAAYHEDTHILVVGFSIGAFYLYEMPDVNMIHSLRYIHLNH